MLPAPSPPNPRETDRHKKTSLEAGFVFLFLTKNLRKILVAAGGLEPPHYF